MSTDHEYEIEAKYEAASAADLIRLRDVFCAMSRHAIRDRDYAPSIHYFDTDDFALDRAGVVLRTMDAHADTFPSEVCVKTKGVLDHGTLKREEYKMQTPKNGLDLAALDTIARAKELVAPAAGKTLTKAFSTVSKRSDICLGFDVGGKTVAIDLALEDVLIVEAATGDVLRHAFEAEIEFKQSKSDKSVTEAEAIVVLDTVKAALKNAAPLTELYEGRGEAGFRLLREKREKSGFSAS